MRLMKCIRIVIEISIKVYSVVASHTPNLCRTILSELFVDNVFELTC